MDIWVVGTTNQLVKGKPYTETKSSKSKSLTGNSPFFVIGLFCTHHSIIVLFFHLTYGNVAFSILAL